MTYVVNRAEFERVMSPLGVALAIRPGTMAIILYIAADIQVTPTMVLPLPNGVVVESSSLVFAGRWFGDDRPVLVRKKESQ